MESGQKNPRVSLKGPKPKKRRFLSMEISEKLHKELKKRAKADDRSMSTYVRRTLEQMFGLAPEGETVPVGGAQQAA